MSCLLHRDTGLHPECIMSLRLIIATSFAEKSIQLSQLARCCYLKSAVSSDQPHCHGGYRRRVHVASGFDRDGLIQSRVCFLQSRDIQ